MLFAGWEVRIVKNCDRGLENAARGRRPRAAFSRPRSQFFTIRTDPKPVNNIHTCIQSFVFLSSIDSGFVRTERYELDVLILFLLQPWSTGTYFFFFFCVQKTVSIFVNTRTKSHESVTVARGQI